MLIDDLAIYLNEISGSEGLHVPFNDVPVHATVQ